MLTSPAIGHHRLTSERYPLSLFEARPPAVHRFGSREVHPARRLLLVDGVPCKLQPRAFDLLVHLIEQRHRVMGSDELLDAIWGDREVQIGSLATAIARIRTALGERDGETFIETHHRIGYRFVAALEGDMGAVY
jgi:DNA-binding winged helix-turn-helix (wHTH) protein